MNIKIFTIYLFAYFGILSFSTANISNVEVTQETNYTGRGNNNEVVLKVKVTANYNQSMQNLILNMSGTTDLNDVSAINVYSTGATNKYDSRKVANYSFVGTATPSSGNITVNLNGSFGTTTYLWLTYNVKSTAVEGNRIDAQLISVRGSNTYSVSGGNPSGEREILLKRKLLFAPGDNNSQHYRIPAIITAADGSLVTLTDKRKTSSTDLPYDIDIVARRSTDGGNTWSSPVTVALGTGYNNGFGDAVLMKAESGKLVALYVGGPGLNQSTPSNPIRSYVSTSSDNGVTWTAPQNITSVIFGSGAPYPRNSWYASFFGSGQGLTLTKGANKGRIMAVAAIRKVSGGALSNYVVYSDDEGVTWNISNEAIAAGDEAKVVQLDNGDVLMSSRAGTRKWAKSTDGGINWTYGGTWNELTGNPTNGDMVRYSSLSAGGDKNRILHTIPFAPSRRNVSMFVSYDEGVSWPLRKTLDFGNSAYSSITILPDNTIGVYVEEDNNGIVYDMYFLNFSLNWLTKGSGFEIVLPKNLDADSDGILDKDEARCTSNASNATKVTSRNATKDREQYFFDWGGNFVVQNGATRTFNLSNGVEIVATFSNVTGTGTIGDQKPGWNGCNHCLDEYYNVGTLDTALGNYGNTSTNVDKTFDVSFKATKNGSDYPLDIIVADGEESSGGQESVQFSIVSSSSAFLELESVDNPSSNHVFTDSSIKYGPSYNQGYRTFYTSNSTNISSPIVIRTNISSPANTGGQAVAFGVWLQCDTDNDGVPNILDTDSDGDGCSDADEGVASAYNAAVKNCIPPVSFTINCAKSKIISNPIAGTPTNLAIELEVNVTNLGNSAAVPVTVSGSGFSILGSAYNVSFSATGLQKVYIPIYYDGSTLGNSTIAVGGESCALNLNQTSNNKKAIIRIWTPSCVETCGPQF